MEGIAAKKLVVHSSVLKKFNVEVGVFAGDNDSSNPLKELSNLPSKEYLRRCFACAVEQNKGDAAAMKEAIRNIPHHAFNIHDKCGDWCGYNKDKVNYQHKSIPGGFKSQDLYKSFTDLYNKIAENADKFAAGASSQANESLNHIITRKAPKNNFYSSSESAHSRVKCAVNQKNFKYHYTEKILKKSGIEPGTYLSHRSNVCTEKFLKYSARSKQPSQKLKRRLNITKRNARRRTKESTEKNTYQCNMTLLNVSNLPKVDAS
ncbi:hypothetical protein PV325_000235 [Microctonus aethiopoides]|nr:hypothetical protein PV325_000235 [Microctonus aethiopoides]